MSGRTPTSQCTTACKKNDSRVLAHFIPHACPFVHRHQSSNSRHHDTCILYSSVLTTTASSLFHRQHVLLFVFFFPDGQQRNINLRRVRSDSNLYTGYQSRTLLLTAAVIGCTPLVRHRDERFSCPNQDGIIELQHSRGKVR